MTANAGDPETTAPQPKWAPSYLDKPGWSWVPTWLHPYLRPEMLGMLMLGFASGLPLYLFYSKTSIWLRAEGIERSTIGFFYWIGLAYTLKWVWAPVIDKTVVPVLGKMFGHRRSWMMVAISGTVLGLFILATADPSQGLLRVLLGAGLIAFSGATLDVSIDAWRIESAPTDAQANMAASYSLGYRGALLFSGLGLVIAGKAGWGMAFVVMALAMAACAGLVALITEPRTRTKGKDLDGLPLFAGAWNAVAVATALFFFARAFRWLKVNAIQMGDLPIGAWLMDGMLLAAVAALLSGALVFKGTKAGLPHRLALAGAGTAFVYARELAVLFGGVAESSPFFKLVTVTISLLMVGLTAWLILSSHGQTGAGKGEAGDQARGKIHALFATPLLQVYDRFGKVLVPILILVLIYRTSDFTMGVMAGPLYVDLGYSPDMIGLVQSGLGVWAVMIGLFIGGLVANQIGVMKSLVVGAVLTLITNGFYAYFAAVATGDDPAFLALAICADNVAGGFVTTVFIAYLSSLVDPAFAATQYALFSSLYALLNKLAAGFSGLMADALGYVGFFLVTASYAIPAALLVVVVAWMQKKHPPKALSG